MTPLTKVRLLKTIFNDAKMVCVLSTGQQSGAEEQGSQKTPIPRDAPVKDIRHAGEQKNADSPQIGMRMAGKKGEDKGRHQQDAEAGEQVGYILHGGETAPFRRVNCAAAPRRVRRTDGR